MKISNGKKHLAKIISENGGWREGAESAAQCVNGEISFWSNTARKDRGEDWCGHYLGKKHDIEFPGIKLPNWHQTILSRDEYFRLYPVAETAPEQVAEAKPSIEQLAADYRSAKDYALRLQEEANIAWNTAEKAKGELIDAGKSIGIDVHPITAKQQPELVITDWRDLKVGDIIEYVDGRNKNRVGMVGRVDSFDLYNADTDRPVRMASDDGQVGWPTKWRFIRRP